MDVSVIMINYNTFELTANAVESIINNTSGIEYEIILVDNLSPDGSGERLRDRFGGAVTYIQSGANLGTSKAFNLALKEAAGRYILWLNTDILIKDNFIKTLADYMDSHPECGICGGNILDFNGNPAHSFAKNFPSLKEIKRNSGLIRRAFSKVFLRPFHDEYNYSDEPLEVGYITGADMMVRRDVFDEAGAFDEDIFMYAEESEFTFRAVKATGKKVVCVPYAHIYHLEGASFGKNKFSERRFLLSVKGTARMFSKCYGTDAALSYLKILRKKSAKAMAVCNLLFRRQSKEKYRAQKIILDELIAGFPALLHD